MNKDEVYKIELHPLLSVFYDAVEQAAHGKGEERHGRGAAFEDQPIIKITEITGLSGPFFQVMKKTHEAIDLYGNGFGPWNKETTYNELLGAIVYLATIAHIVRKDKDKSFHADDQNK